MVVKYMYLSLILLLCSTFVFSRIKSPLSAHFTPDIVKEPSVKLSSPRVAKDRNSHQETIEEAEMNDENDVNRKENIQSTINGTDEEKKPTPHAIPKYVTPSELEHILKNQKKEEELLEEQHELLQKKLLHDYDHYVRDLGSAQDKKVDLEIVNGDVSLKKGAQDSRKPVQPAQDSRKSVQPAPVGTYDLSASEIIPSYSIMYSGSNTGKSVSRQCRE